MSVIVRIDLESEKQYRNKNVSTKIGNKKNQVYFKVQVDDFNFDEAVEAAKVDKNIVMLDYNGSEAFLQSTDKDTTGVYIGVSREVGNNVTEEEIQVILDTIPERFTPIIKIPTEYRNMEFLYRMCVKYPRLRFCGGYVYCLDGCRLGCCGRDVLDKKGIKYSDSDYIKEGCSCALSVIDAEGLELAVSAKAERSSNTSKSSSPTKKAKVMKFSSLLYGGGKVEL